MKKFFCLAMSIMLLSSSVAFANDNMQHDIDIKEEINRALNGISDIPVSQELKDKVTATVINSNGEEMDAEVYYTIREIPNYTRTFSVQNAGTQYVMTAFARSKQKVSDDDARSGKDGLDAYAYASLYWTDNFGNNNTLDSVSGGWDVDGNTTVKSNSRKITYGRSATGGGGTSSSISKTKYPRSNTFEYSVTGIAGIGLYLNTWATVTNGTVSEKIKVSVAPLF